MNEESQAQASRNAALRWGGFVVALLGLQVAGGAAAIYLASNDPSAAVVPNYHEKALNWDREIELQQKSAELNWLVQLDVTAGVHHQGLVVQIKDQAGKYVRLERGDVRLYHHSRAGNILRVPVAHHSAEPIVVADCFARPGLWQVELDIVDAQGNHFVDSQEVRVKTPQSGAS